MAKYNVVTFPNGEKAKSKIGSTAKTHAVIGKYKNEWRVMSLHIMRGKAVDKIKDFVFAQAVYNDYTWTDLQITEVTQE